MWFTEDQRFNKNICLKKFNVNYYILKSFELLRLRLYSGAITCYRSSSCHAASTDIPDPLLPLLAGPQGYIPYPHRAAVCRFKLVTLLLLSHVRGVHRTSLMSSSLLFQQCPACLVRLTWIVFMVGGRWSYSCCFVGYCLQDLFKIARSILV